MAVDDNEAERVACLTSLLDGLKSGLRGWNNGRVHAPESKDGFEDVAIGRVVVDHQNPQLIENRRIGARASGIQRGGISEPGSKVERGSASGLAFNPNFAAHHLDEPDSDR